LADRGGLSPDHAELPRAGQRGTVGAAAGAYQIIAESPAGDQEKAMTAIAQAPLHARQTTYINQSYGVLSWLLTRDHKRIAILYLFGITFFFFIGGFAAFLIRFLLLSPKRPLIKAET